MTTPIHPTISLIVPFYRPKSEQRWVEIRSALSRNLNSGLFSQIALLVDTPIPGLPALSDPRVFVCPLGSRPTYTDAMTIADRFSAEGEEQWIVMANSDIVFGDSLNLLHMIGDQEKPVFICLTRHTFTHDGKWEADPGAHGCQDVWIWRHPLSSILLRKVEEANLRFGVWGSENRLAYEAHSTGHLVVNPGIAIVAKHCHFVDERPLGGRTHQIPGKYMFPLPQRMGEPVMASFAYCHGPGGLESMPFDDLEKMPDECDCSKCTAARGEQTCK